METHVIQHASIQACSSFPGGVSTSTSVSSSAVSAGDEPAGTPLAAATSYTRPGCAMASGANGKVAWASIPGPQRAQQQLRLAARRQKFLMHVSRCYRLPWE